MSSASFEPDPLFPDFDPSSSSLEPDPLFFDPDPLFPEPAVSPSVVGGEVGTEALGTVEPAEDPVPLLVEPDNAAPSSTSSSSIVPDRPTQKPMSRPGPSPRWFRPPSARSPVSSNWNPEHSSPARAAPSQVAPGSGPGSARSTSSWHRRRWGTAHLGARVLTPRTHRPRRPGSTCRQCGEHPWLAAVQRGWPPQAALLGGDTPQ
jgi:hypothetical protein